jgi:hypothetical protein
MRHAPSGMPPDGLFRAIQLCLFRAIQLLLLVVSTSAMQGGGMNSMDTNNNNSICSSNDLAKEIVSL